MSKEQTPTNPKKMSKQITAEELTPFQIIEQTILLMSDDKKANKVILDVTKGIINSLEQEKQKALAEERERSKTKVLEALEKPNQLLIDLLSLQNGPPLEREKAEYFETIKEIDEYLNNEVYPKYQNKYEYR